MIRPRSFALPLRRALSLALAACLAAAPSAPPFISEAAAAPMEAGPAAPIVGQMVARILEQNHYNHHPIDKKTSREFLKNYVESFDYNHMIFEKADVDEFASRWGDTIGERLKEGDVAPAYEIFDKFVTRLGEREAFVRKLTSATFSFDGEDALVVDRHEAPWPAGQKEVENLWKLRVKYELLQERLAKTKPEEQGKTVRLRYERLLRSYKEFDASDVLQTYLTSLTRTFDPHSDYMAAAQKENFDISMRLSLVGIGAVLRSEDGYAKIVSLVPGGPADSDKRIKPNDKIEAIAQGDGPWIEAVGMKLDRLVQLIRGEKGTTVRLRVIPADAIDPSTRVNVSIVRDEIKLTDQEAKAKVITAPQPGGRSIKIGVIDLPSFYADMKSVIEPKSTTRDVEKLLGALRKENVDGVILDLRRNGGGSLSESVALTGLFVSEGPVVQVKDARGLIKVLKDSDVGVAYNGPMLVLTSRTSASASEIFAAALQDYGRAVVAGEKSTFGKGTVQSIIELNQYLPGALRGFKPGAVKLTIQKFYRVSGGSTQHRGVLPDIHLPSLADHMDVTETSMTNALPYDEVEPAQYARVDYVSAPRIRELQKASAERLASNREFQWVKEDIERYKKQKEQKTISLNEAKRLAEKKEEEERQTARKKARAGAKASEMTAVEITLESIDSGKPPVKSTAVVAMPAEDAGTPASETAKEKDGEGKDKDYEKAPPVPDYVLEEGIQILADLMQPISGAHAGQRKDLREAIPQ